jgi:hypothetical protein
MKIQHLNEAIEEAERFLARAKAAKQAHANYSDEPDAELGAWLTHNPRENGAVRRASMDLTRALAQLRSRP